MSLVTTAVVVNSVRVEKLLQDLQEKEEKKRTEVLAIQQKYIQSQQPAAAAETASA
jgi:hypothetical protein